MRINKMYKSEITDQGVEISIIIPVVERYDNLEKLYLSYAEEITKLTKSFEFIFVLDGHMQKAYSELKKFSYKYPQIKTVKFSRTFGEADSLSVGFDKAKGKYVFTLSSYFQVDPEEFKKLYNELINDNCDLVITRRDRKGDSLFNKIQSFIFHTILRILTGARFKDITCGLRGMKREILQDMELYGDLHRFLPIMAISHGYRVKELIVHQSKEDTRLRVYKFRTYLSRLLDLMTIFFLFRFTYKPLRFFGLIGSLLFLSGFFIDSYLIFHRLVMRSIGLTDKPSLFLAALLMVIGVQLFAIGIIGEIIIYTHGKQKKKYHIKTTLD